MLNKGYCVSIDNYCNICAKGISKPLSIFLTIFSIVLYIYLCVA